MQEKYRCLVMPNDWRISHIWQGTEFTIVFENNPNEPVEGNSPISARCLFSHHHSSVIQVSEDVIREYFPKENCPPNFKELFKLSFKKTLLTDLDAEDYGVRILTIEVL